MKHLVLLFALAGVSLACSSDPPARSDEPGTNGAISTSNSSTGTPTTSSGGASATSTTVTTSDVSGTTSTSMGGASGTTTATTTGMAGSTSTTVAAGGTTATSTASTTDAGAGGTGGGGCATLSEAIDQGGTYVLAFGNTYFAAVPAGGKIVEFRQSAGSNLLTNNTVNETNFGGTLWTSPQADWNWPPPTELDSDPYTVAADEGTATITMTSGVSTSVGPQVSVTKVFAADLCNDAIDITYTVTNEGSSAASFTPWEVSRAPQGGLGFFAGTRTGYDTDVLPATEMDGMIWFDHGTQTSTDAKLFADGSGGYLAFTNGTDLFVKKFADVAPGAQAPNEAEVELYDGATYVEYELQGNYGSVPAGGTVSMQVRWIVRPFPAGATRAVGDAALVSAVMELL